MLMLAVRHISCSNDELEAIAPRPVDPGDDVVFALRPFEAQIRAGRKSSDLRVVDEDAIVAQPIAPLLGSREDEGASCHRWNNVS